jgi:hypothetical protein
MLLGGPQNTIKSHLVFTALFCFAPFSVFSSRMSAPHCEYTHKTTPLDRLNGSVSLNPRRRTAHSLSDR